MRIAFVHDWEPDTEQEATWEDGLAAAILELRRRGNSVVAFTCGPFDGIIDAPLFDITVTNDMKRMVNLFKPDVILMWGDMTRPNAKPLKSLGKPMAICFAGGDTNRDNTSLFGHIFVESQVYKDRLEHDGFSVSLAFGTNTNLFTSIDQPKVFDTIFPATFATWKRHGLYALATQGLVSLAVGYMYYDHETDCWKDCLKRGVMVMPHVSAQALHRLYAASRVCVVPSESAGGSQRTVLEAMAMNIPVVVTDSDKFEWAGDKVWRCAPDAQEIRSLVDVLLDGEHETDTRDFIVNNWSHITYADALEAGLQSIL